jgi:hypothetical protein
VALLPTSRRRSQQTAKTLRVRTKGTKKAFTAITGSMPCRPAERRALEEELESSRNDLPRTCIQRQRRPTCIGKSVLDLETTCVDGAPPGSVMNASGAMVTPFVFFVFAKPSW